MNKDLCKFESLPITILSSYGHNGLDWVHSLLDSHPEILLMPAFSFYRTLDFFKLKHGDAFERYNDKQISTKLSSFLYRDESYQVVRRKFLISALSPFQFLGIRLNFLAENKNALL